MRTTLTPDDDVAALLESPRVSLLPPYHRDPFDRLLVAQALVGRLPLLTADPVFALYGIELMAA